MKVRSLIISLFLLMLGFTAFPEVKDIGVPFIRNFNKSDYKAGAQNWAITQDQRGFIYFANHSGVLVFDGVRWLLHNIPNTSMVRSVYIDESGRIYAGAYNDIGVMKVGANGQMDFHSLKKFIPEDYRNFDDIWKIFPYQDKIVFQSYNFALLCKDDTTFTSIKAPSRFLNCYKVGDRCYFNDLEKGLLEFDGKNLLPLTGCEPLIGEEIWSVLPFGGDNRLIIGTLSRGLFIYDGNTLQEWKVPVNDFLKKNQIFCSVMIKDNYYVYGTIQDGIVIIDNQGRVVQHINRKKGIQNNTILSLFNDRDGNLWLGLDNGIDFVNINSPITFLQQRENVGAGYTALIHDNKIFYGTNQGLFVQKWAINAPGNDLKMIPGTSGQVWYLGLHNNNLICGHNNGTFLIEGENAKLINRIPGAWKYHTLARFPDWLIAGTYSGLIAFKKVNGSIVFDHKIVGFSESSRVFEEDDDGNLWVSHGFKGIYKIKFGNDINSIASYRYYSTKDGLPSNYNLSVTKINGKIFFASDNGIYEYNNLTDRFQASTYLNGILSPVRDISFLKEDSSGNIWYVSKNKSGLLQLGREGEYKHITEPFSLLSGMFIKGFEYIYNYLPDHAIFGVEDGFINYSPEERSSQNKKFSAYISTASALHLDSTFYFGNFSLSGQKSESPGFYFPFKKNAFRFIYTSPVYDNFRDIEYSYKLIGYDEEWSSWSSSTLTEYTNLPGGEYTFVVKARNQSGVESDTDSLVINVLPPWYRTVWAYITYALILILIVMLSVWTFFKRIEISKRRERLNHLRSFRKREQEFVRQALISEKKIVSLKNEKLKIEMIHRDKELANQTMDLIRKNKFLLKLKDDLQKIKESGINESLKDKISSMINRIDRDIDHNKQWEVFETAFDEVHEDFLGRLKAHFPSLTPKELRLCAYLRMNISTKEIAPLMNISIRGVEICRYRVRKKLNIDRDTNLTSLIMEL